MTPPSTAPSPRGSSFGFVLQRRPIGLRIGIGFGVVLALAGIVAATGLSGFTLVRRYNGRMGLADRIIVSVQKARIHERNFVLRGEERDSREVEAAVDALRSVTGLSRGEEDLKAHLGPILEAAGSYGEAFRAYRSRVVQRNTHLKAMAEAARDLERQAEAVRAGAVERVESATRHARDEEAAAFEMSNQMHELLVLIQTARLWEQTFASTRYIHHQFKCGESIEKILEHIDQMPKGAEEEKIKLLRAGARAYQKDFTQWVGEEIKLFELQKKMKANIQNAVDRTRGLAGEKSEVAIPEALPAAPPPEILRLTIRLQSIRLHEWEHEQAKLEKLQEKEMKRADDAALNDIAAALESCRQTEASLAEPEARKSVERVRSEIEDYRATLDLLKGHRATLKAHEETRTVNAERMISMAKEILEGQNRRLDDARREFRDALAWAARGTEGAHRLSHLVRSCRAHERGFLSGFSDGDRDAVFETVKEMENSASNLSGIMASRPGTPSQADAGALATPIAVYRRAFGGLVDTVMQLSRSDADMERNAGRIEDLGAEFGRIQADLLTGTIHRSLWTVLGTSSLALAAGLLLSVFITRGVTRPLAGTVAVIRRLEEGDLTARPPRQGSDEIGVMNRALGTALERLDETVRHIAADGHTLASSAEQLSAASDGISASAAETSTQARTVATAAEDVGRSVRSVAASSEQMATGLRVTAGDVAEASRVAAEAVEEARRGTEIVLKLGEGGTQVDKIVKVIREVARQTNYLALNATIEAARAGDRGRGFAVVAQEVKTLADQTAAHTQDIALMIETLQNGVRAAVEIILRIGKIITKMSDLQASVTKAIDGHCASTNEISRNAGVAAQGSMEISRNIAGVAQAMEATTEGTNQIRQAARELSGMASDLRIVIAGFICSATPLPKPAPASPDSHPADAVFTTP